MTTAARDAATIAADHLTKAHDHLMRAGIALSTTATRDTLNKIITLREVTDATSADIQRELDAGNPHPPALFGPSYR